MKKWMIFLFFVMFQACGGRSDDGNPFLRGIGGSSADRGALGVGAGGAGGAKDESREEMVTIDPDSDYILGFSAEVEDTGEPWSANQYAPDLTLAITYPDGRQRLLQESGHNSFSVYGEFVVSGKDLLTGCEVRVFNLSSTAPYLAGEAFAQPTSSFVVGTVFVSGEHMFVKVAEYTVEAV